MIRGALDVGAEVYDLRGISDTLDPDDHLFGLIQFKLGTGGEAVEYLGEWDYPAEPLALQGFHRLPASVDDLHPARRRADAGAAHLTAVLAAVPGLVPVAKGNGYGFGHRAAGGDEAARLGSPRARGRRRPTRLGAARGRLRRRPARPHPVAPGDRPVPPSPTDA